MSKIQTITLGWIFRAHPLAARYFRDAVAAIIRESGHKSHERRSRPMKEKTPTVKSILIEYLRNHGYDGLYNAWSECGCDLEDFIPCGEIYECCRAGYRGPCTCGDCDFHISPERQTNEDTRSNPDPPGAGETDPRGGMDNRT